MKLLLIADPSSSHTIKWSNYLAQKGIEICVFGLSAFEPGLYKEGIRVESMKSSKFIQSQKDGSLLKSFYLNAVPKVKKIIKDFKPDIIHSHYASSYGLIGALTNFHPFVLSIWGNDVFDFPRKTFLHKLIFKFILDKTDYILATSEVMQKEAAIYTDKYVEVLPFGVDIEKFIPINKGQKNKNTLYIGLIKSLESHYGIEYLIKAFKLVKQKELPVDIKLMIIGSGSIGKKLKKLAADLKLQNDIQFIGNISNESAPEYHNKLDIEVYLSVKESFGVSVVEALACEKPVVVSNIGGLNEIVNDGINGFVVESRDYHSAAGKIIELIQNPGLRIIFGKSGRQKVILKYDFNKNVNRMFEIYKSLL
jgi:glycosyltransferase involved in cell wall biosynthesis